MRSRTMALMSGCSNQRRTCILMQSTNHSSGGACTFLCLYGKLKRVLLFRVPVMYSIVHVNLPFGH
jgi:hypothetical protein